MSRFDFRSWTRSLKLVFFCLWPADAAQEEGKAPRKLNFRRLLLNKCQEEFEKGDAAMNAVAEREKKDKERKEAGEVDAVRGWGQQTRAGAQNRGIEACLLPGERVQVQTLF